jgi:UDP-N-acetylglucosamine--N-acetylmuramyl-(pentapeptide) pyrophosphoryl-undecaprenol N-acetylglucosamine transferase
MEMQNTASGFQIRGLWIAGLQRKISLQNLMFHLPWIVYGKQKNNKRV